MGMDDLRVNSLCKLVNIFVMHIFGIQCFSACVVWVGGRGVDYGVVCDLMFVVLSFTGFHCLANFLSLYECLI